MGRTLLVLSDGMVFEGWNFGAEGETIGEVVFNTSMTGYQEILTDPSYKGQIVTMTYTQIGNYGINTEDIESSGGPKVEGFVVKEYLDFPSNWRSEKFTVHGSRFTVIKSLGDYLREYGIVGIQGIDTRALTRHLRDNGVQMGIISTVDLNPESLLEKVRKHPGISAFDLVKDVTTQKQYKWIEDVWKWLKDSNELQVTSWGNAECGMRNAELKSEIPGLASRSRAGRNPKSEIFGNSSLVTQPALSLSKGHSSLKKVVVYDFGVKYNILRNLVDTGFDVTVVPASTPAETVLEMDADGVLLSNGPGDPQVVTYAIENAKKLLGKKPIFGICLGHQILGLALGGNTYKLKFGHHGGNHPVKNLHTDKVEITSQNHNYCVDVKSLNGKVKLTHKNLYDGTEEGMKHMDLPVFSVQYHPEAGPGPNDSVYLFKRFREMIEGK